MNQLEIGTEIFCRNYGDDRFFGKIDRVTNTMAYCGSKKFKRGYDSYWLNEVGRPRWNTASYFIPSENDKIELKRRTLINKVVNFDYSKLSFDKICEIHEILISG